VTGAAHPAGPLERDLLELAAIPAPTGAEGARLDWLERRLAGAPGDLRRDAAGNLVWRLGGGRPALALLAHVDTVFAADVPHAPAVRGRWLHGPGIGDNAAAVVVAVHVVEALGPALARPPAVVFTVAEEGLGNLRGALHACAEIRPEAALALEGHGLEHVGVDAVGSVRARIAVTGPGGHSWWDRGRPSAVHALARVLVDLVDGAPGGTAVNVGLVEGGSAVNAIAAGAAATVEARSLKEAALDAFAAGLEALAVPGGLALAVEPAGRRPAGRLDRSHPLLEAVRAVRAGLGLPDSLGDGSTDANAALAHGIPALALGCARGRDMHAPGERIERASLDLGRAQLDGVLRRFLGG
jgi:tripeptide aminopeptidase